MKNNCSFLLLLLLLYCSPPVDFAPPLYVTLPEYPETNTDLQAVWERVQQVEEEIITFGIDEETLWAKAIVTSSDAGGNFYKELYVQDTLLPPKRALRLFLDRSALHSKYLPSQKILIKLNGLSAGIHNGVLTLGTYQADGIAHLSEPLIDQHLIRTAERLKPEPLSVSLEALNSDLVGKWVQLSAVQFAKAEIGKTFAAEAFDTYEGQRRLVACNDQRSIVLSSSRYSKFKSLALRALSGTVQGILTRDYYDEKYILKINSPNNIHFDSDRCDPFFEESFETVPLGRFDKAGWQNITEAGSQYWEVYEDANSLGQSIRVGSYRSKDKSTVAWLITPPFELNTLNNAELHFRSSTRFADKSKLEVLIATDYNGHPNDLKKATWKVVKPRIATANDNDQEWIDSGGIPLGGTSGVIYVAFRYSGSGKTAYDGTFELDDIRIINN